MATEDTISYDLRYRHGKKKVFSINDIHYSVEQDKDSNLNVAKAIIIEKQPKYPIYTEAGFNAAYNFGSIIAKAIMGGSVAETYGKVGTPVLQQTAQNVTKSIGNALVNTFSTEKGASEYYTSGKSSSVVRNLFDVDAASGGFIASYELPFLSDYFFEADGHSGWEVNGVEAMIGQFKDIASYINVGYPVTPNWKYESKCLRTDFEFNLINDTTENLKKNLRLVTAMLPGMMHVLLDGTQVTNAAAKAVGKKVGATFGNVVSDVGSIADAIRKIATMYKSPNVYEVIVPGRFRWLWCTMDMKIDYVGKIYHDTVGNDIAPIFGLKPELVGFPEVFKIKIGIESLLPQSFNEFYYFMTNLDLNATISDNTKKEAQENIDRITQQFTQQFTQNTNYLPSPNKSVQNFMNQMKASQNGGTQTTQYGPLISNLPQNNNGR